jgi:hypothetical protein
LGHLDSEPNADQHYYTHAHTDSFGDIFLSPNLDASPDEYTLAIFHAHKAPLEHA